MGSRTSRLRRARVSVGIEGPHGAHACERQVDTGHHWKPPAMAREGGAARGGKDDYESQGGREANPSWRPSAFRRRAHHRRAGRGLHEPATWRCTASPRQRARHAICSTSTSCRISGHCASARFHPTRWRLSTVGCTKHRPRRTRPWRCSRGFYRHAEVSGHAMEGGNPCRFLKRYPARSRVRVMSIAEVERLGIALDELESRGKSRQARLWRFDCCW